MKRFTLLVVFLAVAMSAFCQGRRLWPGDATVSGTFTANRLAATETVAADYMIFGVSETAVKIDSTPADGQGLIYDATAAAYIPGNPASSIGALGSISDVSAAAKQSGDVISWNGVWWDSIRPSTALLKDVSQTTKAEGWLLGWNATDLIWEATPAPAGSSGSTTLAGLTDTAIVAPASGEYLQHNGTAWVDNPFTQALNDLSDVESVAPSDNDVLTYDSAVSRWKPEAGGSASAFTDLTDTPASYVGASEYFVKVNVAANGLEFAAGAAGAAKVPVTKIVASVGSLDTTRADYVCDGTADEVQIQAAIDSINATSGTVVLLGGGFNIAAPIRMATQGISLIGQGPVQSLLYRGYNEATNSSGLIYITAAYTSVENMAIDGGRAVYTSTDNHSIYTFANLTNLFFSKLNLTQTRGSGIYLSATTVNSKTSVSDCIASKNGEGFYNNGADYVSFTRCQGIANTAHGFYVVSGDYINMLDCFATLNGSDGIYLGTGTGSKAVECLSTSNTNLGFYMLCTNGIIEACAAVSNTGHGMRVSGTNCIINDNYIAGNDVGIYLDGTDDYIQITSNTLSANINNTGAISVGSGNDYIRIQNNVIIGQTTGPGITATSSDYLVIQGNSFAGNYKNALSAATSNYVDFINNDCKFNANNTTSADVDVSNCDFVRIHNNYFRADQPVYAVNIDDSVAAQSTGVTMVGNQYAGTYTGDYVLESGQTVHPDRWMELTDQATGYARVMIGSASADACIGFATSDPSTINHVITVSQNATSNPIATAWDVWSLPSLKEDITPIAKEESALDVIKSLNLIKFTWKYPESIPREENFPDILDSRGETELLGKTLYADSLKAYEAQKAAWDAQKNKTESWSADIMNDFPDELASFNNEGKKSGINQTAILWRVVKALQEAEARIAVLESKLNQ
jgi:parallel beta-helix repeat protein